MRCPHGGSVRVDTAGTSAVRVRGARLASADDVFTVVGCPHTDGGRPRPCTTVRFTPGADGAGGGGVLAGGRPVLLSGTAAQCFADDLTPHGPPVADTAPQGVSCR
nr:hypothetical protein [Streptomyces sp. HNM0574]